MTLKMGGRLILEVDLYTSKYGIQDLSVASSVSLIRMSGNVETKSSAMLLSVYHSSEMKKKIAMKIILVLSE